MSRIVRERQSRKKKIDNESFQVSKKYFAISDVEFERETPWNSEFLLLITIKCRIFDDIKLTDWHKNSPKCWNLSIFVCSKSALWTIIFLCDVDGFWARICRKFIFPRLSLPSLLTFFTLTQTLSVEHKAFWEVFLI